MTPTTAWKVRWLTCAATLFLALRVLAWPQYALGTWVWIACGLVLVACWPRPGEAPSSRSWSWPGLVASAAAVAACLWALLSAATRVLPDVFAGPPDANRGDMLVALNLAADAFLSGHNPYRLYHVPWEVPLAYGPGLWLPHVAAHLLRVDSRILTLVGQLTIPAACGLVASWDASRGRWVRAASLLALAMTTVLQPQMLEFFRIGHTQVYWPLLLVFAWLVVAERWTAACLVLGLLIASRSTMVAIVPILLITLRQRGMLTWRRVAVLALASIGPFLPFLANDPHAVIYGLYGSYQTVMKGYVWRQTTWALTTFGSTGPLLARGLGRYVELVQLVALGIVYAAAWVSLRARQSPVPWMGFALLVFSMTTLWPVLYIYFDVWLLLLSGLVASTVQATAPESKARLMRLLGAALATAVVVVLVAGAQVRGSAYSIDIGTPESAGMTGGGFGRDRSEMDEGRTFVWVQGPSARVRVPRAGLTGGRIRIALRPFTSANPVQSITAQLNGRPLGEMPLTPGWQEVVFDAPRSTWLYGFNLLDVGMHAANASPAGVGDDAAAPSVGIDRITVE